MFDTYLNGVFWMLINTFFCSVNYAAAKVLRDYLSGVELGFGKYLLSFVCMLPWFFVRKYKCNFFLHGIIFLTAVSHATGNILVYSAMKEVPLPMITAITTSCPLFAMIFSVIMLGERPGVASWFGMFVGLIGVMIIIEPWNEYKFSIHAIMVLICSLLWGMGEVLMKICAEKGNIKAQVFFLITYKTLFSGMVFGLIYYNILPAGNFLGVMMDLSALDIRFVIALIVCVGSVIMHNFSFFKSFETTPVYVVVPFYFFTLVFSSILSYFLFDQLISFNTLMGSIILIVSTAYSLYCTRKRNLSTKL